MTTQHRPQHPSRVKLRGKEFDVTGIHNVTQSGSVGEEEILYVLSGWGDDPIGYLNWQLDDLIKDGLAEILDYE